MDYVYAFNAFETVLWTLLAVYCIVSAIQIPERRIRLLFAALAFLAFAGSEIMEMQTGAWWRPIWLLIWKAACITILIVLGIDHFRWHRKNSEESP
ncbi:MAG: hypothetical protein WAO83_22060 [Fuerstiella sp.]